MLDRLSEKILPAWAHDSGPVRETFLRDTASYPMAATGIVLVAVGVFWAYKRKCMVLKREHDIQKKFLSGNFLNRKSELSGEQMYKGTWQVHFVRMVGGQHTFLIIEKMKKDGARTLWRADFRPTSADQGQGMVTINQFDYSRDTERTLLQQALDQDGHLNEGDDLPPHVSFDLPKRIGELLLNNISQKIEVAIPYSVVGDQSALGSSLGRGHNCYTWVKHHLHNLNYRPLSDALLEKQTSLSDKFASIPSSHVPGDGHPVVG